MSPARVAILAVLIPLALSSTGCFWKKKPPAPPAIPPPAPKSTATVKPAPPPPKIETKVNESVPPVAVKMPDTPKPPQAKQTPRRPRRNPPAAAAKTQPPVPTPDPSPTEAPAPKLGEMLTETQRADILARCDRSMQHARAMLDKLAGKQVAAEELERVKVFLQQAEQARARDPQTALQLAQRAEVLARDLLKTTR